MTDSTGALAIPHSRDEPLVFTMTEPLSGDGVARLREKLRAVPTLRHLVVDVTAVPSFDSDGIAALTALHDDIGRRRMVVVGLREAAARLVGNAELSIETRPGDRRETPVQLRQLPGLIVVTCLDRPTAGQFNLGLRTAIAADVAIVAVDLDQLPTLDADLIDALAFASSEAAMRGQELLLLNISTEASNALRTASLAATTYLAAT